MIIDFHTHIFPDKIAARTIEILENNIFKIQHEVHKAAIPATLEDLKKSMHDCGIDKSVVMPIATTVTQSTSINKFAAQINNTDGIFSFGSLHPMQEDWEDVLYDIKQKGLHGIKLHPEYQDFYIDSPESIRILKKCEELDLIVMLHTGYDIGIKPPAHCMPDRLKNALNYVSGEKIIAAHLGGWRAWDEVEKHLIDTPIYFDTAYTVFDIPEEQLLRIIRNHGSEKILFATDSPWEAQNLTVKKLSEIGLSNEEADNIFFKNAKKLLKI
jgi:hypothetical protein